MKKVKLTLVGLDGNAFYLMGAFANAAREQGFDDSYINDVMNRCKSGDYNNLLCVLMDACEDSDEDD